MELPSRAFPERYRSLSTTSSSPPINLSRLSLLLLSRCRPLPAPPLLPPFGPPAAPAHPSASRLPQNIRLSPSTGALEAVALAPRRLCLSCRCREGLPWRLSPKPWSSTSSSSSLPHEKPLLPLPAPLSTSRSRRPREARERG